MRVFGLLMTLALFLLQSLSSRQPHALGGTRGRNVQPGGGRTTFGGEEERLLECHSRARSRSSSPLAQTFNGVFLNGPIRRLRPDRMRGGDSRDQEEGGEGRYSDVVYEGEEMDYRDEDAEQKGNAGEEDGRGDYMNEVMVDDYDNAGDNGNANENNGGGTEGITIDVEEDWRSPRAQARLTNPRGHQPEPGQSNSEAVTPGRGQGQGQGKDEAGRDWRRQRNSGGDRGGNGGNRRRGRLQRGGYTNNINSRQRRGGYAARRGKYMYKGQYDRPQRRGPIKRRIGEIPIDPAITRDVLKERKSQIDTRATEIENQMLTLKSKILNISESIIEMKAEKLRLQQDPVAARLDELRFQEKAAVENEDYLTAHNLKLEIQQLAPHERVQNNSNIATDKSVSLVEAEMLT